MMVNENVIRRIVEQVYETAVQDIEGLRAGKKGYRMRHDEVSQLATKEILKLTSEEIYRQVREELQRARGVK